jgi:flagellar hook-associated protein 1 FlgK
LRREEFAGAAVLADGAARPMSLNVALNTAVSGLFANQKAIAATSENIANVNTPDYTRRKAHFYADAIPDQFAGVDVDIVRAAVDRFIQGAAYRGGADAAMATAIADALSRVEASLGAPGDDISFSNLLDEAFAALTTLAANPSSLAAKADALDALNQAFAAFARTQNAIANEIAGADGRLAIDLERVNALLEEVYRLNTNVPDSPGSADLLDARLTELSKLISIQVTRNDLGQATVAASDGTVLASAGGYTALGVVAGTPLRLSLSTVDPETRGRTLVNGDFGAAITSGDVRGLLDLRNTELPALSALVAQAAGGVATELNNAYALNAVVGATASTTDTLITVDANGNDAVNPAILADPALFAIARPTGGAAAGANDGSGATALAFVGGSAAARDVAQAIARIGSAARNAELAASTNEALAAELTARVSAAGGVNLDEELSNLILFQRAYNANARVIAAIDELWQALLSII